ncbi:type III PLP-dependent enzyme [Paenibacillus sp. p3-SID1389]|uniref:type III PLP-dependent enzyme n=1 Tax=Paenibacillus sp. p3-SID1389 TaxID=2916364 RepID=UPI0021A5A9DC|nr:type III PLP-dependent enzyme [Paenibacillus sp. p3-SID1389]MCT2193555.1 type III PLP-dependent enzyme [Paenibacillus sp. p3-SID1389]
MKAYVREAINRLQAESREPFCAYLYDLGGIRAHVRRMRRYMPERTGLFYAIKANPDRRIIEALLPLIDGFEVASAGELLKVREVSGSVPVLFGGPGKKEAELEAAIRHNVSYIHVESLLELRRLIRLTQGRSEPVRILLRMNLRTSALPLTQITMGGRPTPFGLDEELLDEAIAVIREEGRGAVRLCGFHFHSLSNNLRAELHAEMIELYLRKAEEWMERYRLDIEIVNAGGGFGVRYDDAPAFDWALFTSLIARSEARKRLARVQLWFEPGRFLVADHGYYAAEVIDIKPSHDRHFAVLRGGTHHNRLPASWGHNHPFAILPAERWAYPFARPEIRRGKVTLVGELCTPKDRLHADAEVELLRVGDIVVFEKSGAYCWTISHHDFLGHPHPKFYYLAEGNDHAYHANMDN